MKRTDCGVSMVEIMVSILIFGFCLLPVFELISRSNQTVHVTQDEIKAFSLSAELIDQISCMPFDAIPVMNEYPLKNSDNGSQLYENKIATKLILSELPDGYVRFLTIETVSPRMKLIKAKIEWGTNPRHQQSFQSILEWTP
ncbi:MAG: hypothetical protein HQM09_04875 [Candidatus Riflebacteria bacterium]|nr:hypothetical protein [Candidatus Riflebacteria bacterium]